VTGHLSIETCDACRRERQRCEQTMRDGIRLWLCVAWRKCIDAQPSLDVMAGRVPPGPDSRRTA
jgi:hypothetical protein